MTTAADFMTALVPWAGIVPMPLARLRADSTLDSGPVATVVQAIQSLGI